MSPVSAQTAPTDSGRASSPSSAVLEALFPVPRNAMNMARYAIPDFCVVMARRTADSVRWGQRDDTLPFNPHSSLPALAIQRAKQCLTQFPAVSVAPISFGIVRELALMANEDDTYQTIVSRQLASATTPDQRIGIMQGVVMQLLAFTPARIVLARQYIEQSTVMFGGDTAGLAAQRNLATTLAQHALELNNIPLMDSMIHRGALLESQRYTLIAVPTKEDQITHTQTLSYLARLSLYPIALRQGGQKAIEQMDSILMLTGLFLEMRDPDRDYRPRDLLRWRLVGQEAPVLQPPFRFPDTKTRLPEPGRISMLVQVDMNCGVGCYPMYFMLRRLQQQHPDLRVILLAQAAGSVRLRTPRSVGEVAEQMRAYFVDSLNVASSIVVDTAPSMQLSAPDRRLIYGPSEMREDYLSSDLSSTDSLVPGAPRPDGSGPFLLIDERGRVVWQSRLAGLLRQEQFLSAYIKRLLDDDTH